MQGIARAALNSPHRLLDPFEWLGKNSHLYSLNKCSTTKCAEDPNEIPLLLSGLSLDDGVRSVDHTAVFVFAIKVLTLRAISVNASYRKKFFRNL